MSGSLLGRRNLSDVIGVRPAESFDGLRSLSGRGPGADGVRAGASMIWLGVGKVSARFMPNLSDSKSC